MFQCSWWHAWPLHVCYTADPSLFLTQSLVIVLVVFLLFGCATVRIFVVCLCLVVCILLYVCVVIIGCATVRVIVFLVVLLLLLLVGWMFLFFFWLRVLLFFCLPFDQQMVLGQVGSRRVEQNVGWF